LNPDTGYLYVAGIGTVGSNMNWERRVNTWSPRVGVAYQVRPETVIRAGYGRSFDIGVFGSIFGHAATQNLPVLSSQQVTQTAGPNSAPFTLAQGPPAPTPTVVPANGLLPNPGTQVNSRARPNPLRLPTLDAWNASLQQSLTPTLSLTIAYVGNKGTHTLADGSGNTTNPMEAAIFLPAQFSITGQPLNFDPSVSTTTFYPGVKALNGQPVPGISPTGGTNNQTYLTRYYGGKLPACADPNYHLPTPVDPLIGPGQCGWTNGITNYSDDFNTHYNALQVTLAKTFTKGFSMNANYAWQHAVSWQSSYYTWSHAATKGTDGFLRRQQIIIYGLYELPFGRNKTFGSGVGPITNQIIGGWQLSPVLNYSSGLPFTLVLGGCPGIPGSAPCYMNGDKTRFQRQITGAPYTSLHYFNATTLSTIFTTPGLDQIGTLGRNSLYGPHFFNTDLSVMKSFPIHEAATIQFRMDAYNVFNYISFGTPSGVDGTISNGPGKDGTANPRQLQLSFRVQF